VTGNRALVAVADLLGSTYGSATKIQDQLRSRFGGRSILA
jgi:hypothetical protein